MFQFQVKISDLNSAKENWSWADKVIKMKSAKVVLEPLHPNLIKQELGRVTNPWLVDQLDVFLHYCCPECDLKSQSKDIFVNHAFLNHPQVLQLSWSCSPPAAEYAPVLTVYFPVLVYGILGKGGLPVKKIPKDHFYFLFFVFSPYGRIRTCSTLYQLCVRSVPGSRPHCYR